MADEISLDPRGFEAALSVLDREQKGCLPTLREARLYRAFSASAYLMGVLTVSSFVAMAMGEAGAARLPPIVNVVVLGLTGALGITTLVLFILNWSLMRKLYLHAQLRRRLRLRSFFEPAFSALQGNSRVQNLVTGMMVVVGGLLALVGLLLLFVAVAAWSSTGLLSLTTAQFLLVLPVPIAVLGTGIGVASLHFVRRGKQRLELVLRLRADLAQQAGGSSEPSGVTLSSKDYEAIAGLEREHIIRERASSIMLGRKEAEESSYLCQSSRQLLVAKSRLEPDLLAKVEGTIAELLADPAGSKAVDEPHTGHRIVDVAGTSLRIQYEVDRQKKLVRLFDLQAGPTDAAGGAHGVS